MPEPARPDDTAMRPRIYDCFCYFNEDMILEIRLETLWDHVDYFVIAEAVYTQVGNPKPLNFDPARFDKYKSKIRYIVVDSFPPGPMDAWKNETNQRNCLVEGLYDARDDDWIIVSDLDEIPRPESIRQYDPARYKRADFRQTLYAYLLNNQQVESGRPVVWTGSRLTTWRNFREFFGSATAVRSYKSSGLLRRLKREWFKLFQLQTISDGGWHFTWMLRPENIVTKMEAIAEQEFVRPEYKQLDVIKARIAAGEDVLNRHHTFVATEVVAPAFPDFLVRHIDKYRDWLR